jgi:hypothetical protein
LLKLEFLVPLLPLPCHLLLELYHLLLELYHLLLELYHLLLAAGRYL